MSLKTKVITLIFCVFGAYALVGYAVQQFVLLPAFVQLEQASATKNTERAVQALEREVELLIPSAADWATWDDTYQFMVDRNEEYIKANLSVKAMETLKVDLIGFYDLKGKRLWGLAYDHEKQEEMALGELSADALDAANPLLAASDTMATVAGIFSTPAGVFLIASRPVLTSNGDGPSHGRFVIGRQLNQDAIERLGTQARVQLHVQPLVAAANQPADQSKGSGSLGYTPILLTENEAITSGITDVLDLAGMPILRFQVDTPRTILAQGRTTLLYAALSLTFSGIILLLVLLVFLRRTVFDPVSTLTRHAITVGTQGDLSAGLQMKRDDEIGILAREFDIMVQRLAEARQRLQEQSYNSGIAEMASGALHNIGNAITPVGVKLINLRREIKQAPVQEMAMASAELADPATPAERKADLVRFSELASGELASLFTRTVDELEAIRSQVDQVQLILADQQRFSRAERTIEPLVVDRLIKEVAQTLPEELGNSLDVELDQGLAEVGPVLFARIALQQIVNNLLINAAESIAECDRQDGSGHIRIYAVADLDNKGMAHICMEDNGMGLSAEQLPRLFERGFTTKSRGSGIGLHWCANTVADMGGRIYVTSGGPGQGACLHLLLPLAEQVTTTMEDAT